jgi:hypothetical protein
VHILSSLERRPETWDSDPESARAALSAAISLVLRLIGRESDPAKSREHVLLAVLAERRLLAGESAELGSLLEEVLHPPVERIGALEVNEFPVAEGAAQPRGRPEHVAGVAHVCDLAPGRVARRARVAHAARGTDPGGHRQRRAPR